MSESTDAGGDTGEVSIMCEEIIEKLKLLDYEVLFTRSK